MFGLKAFAVDSVVNEIRRERFFVPSEEKNKTFVFAFFRREIGGKLLNSNDWTF